jgi:hypothetical protein
VVVSGLAFKRTIYLSVIPGLALAGLSLAGAGRAPSDKLYADAGIRPEIVRQGTLGSCYFHSVVAAFANARPDILEKMITRNEDGTYTVTFSDGAKENAYPEDIEFARTSGYDRSDGLWVVVLFRAYAQRVLRATILKAVDQSSLFPMAKKYAGDFIKTNDPLLLAYDRAIRAVVDQAGNMDRKELEAKLQEQLASISVPDSMKNSFVGMLESGGLFDAISNMVKENGELFGAYRAVGQGGIAERVMQVFGGEGVLAVPNQDESQTARALTIATEDHRPVVACTGGSQYYKLMASGQTLPSDVQSWYVNAHCYTVLGYDPDGRVVTVRNPWGEHPDPDGVLRLPLQSFMPAYRGIATLGP